MNMNNKRNIQEQNFDPMEVQTAINTLNDFNKQQEALEKVQFSDLIRFVSHRFSESRQKNREEVQNKLKAAVNILKRHSSTLPEWEQGTPIQQNFALFARTVIDRFNNYIDKWQKKTHRSAKEKIADLLTEHRQLLKTMGKIELPLKNRRYLDFSEKKEAHFLNVGLFQPFEGSFQKISQLNVIDSFGIATPSRNIPHLTPQAVQLFYMKMIALVENHPALSNTDARKLVYQAKIETEIIQEAQCCRVVGSINHLPDYTVKIIGTFEKDPKSSLFSIPSNKIPFKLDLISSN